MLLNNQLKSLSNIAKSLTLHLTKSYVKQSDIDQISKNYGQTKFQKIKMYAAIFKHIGFQGLKGFKQDVTLGLELRKKQATQDQLTYEQTKQLMRIHHDLLKMGPLMIIQILPFSGPLFMLYMYTYPGSIPSWFMIDYYHDRHEELKVQNQTKALKHYQQLGLKPQQININEMTLPQLRKICLLLFGIYRDGTVGYRKLFNTKIAYFTFQNYSKYLIKKDLKKRFRRDLILNKFTNQMNSLEEMVRWKYQKIMNGQYRFEYKPMYEKTLEKMMTNEGEESVMFREIEKENLETPVQQNKPKIDSSSQQNNKK